MEYGVELIEKYFGNLTDCQREQFAALGTAYAEWNARINVVSRKDFDSLYLRHILHSLAIARVCRFDDHKKIKIYFCCMSFSITSISTCNFFGKISNFYCTIQIFHHHIISFCLIFNLRFYNASP